jgi:hypothetical protein
MTLGFFSIWGILFVIFFPFFWQPSSPMVRFIDAFSRMSPNHCQYGQIHGVNILGYIYGSILMFAVPGALWKSIRGEMFKKSLGGMLHVMTLGMVLVICLFQVKFQIRQFAYEYKYFRGPDTTVKYQKMHKDTFGFARYCQANISGYKRAVIKSDLDLEKGEGFFKKTVLAYFLYPIDILGKHYDEPEAIIVYQKANPQRSVPDGFAAFAPYDKDSLIAVREEVP